MVNADLGVITQSKDYGLLDREAVRARLARPPDLECTHPESGAFRNLYDCPDISLTEAGPHVRVIVATHPATSTKPPIGVQRGGMVYELFVSTLPQGAFAPKDVLDLYLHRGSFPKEGFIAQLCILVAHPVGNGIILVRYSQACYTSQYGKHQMAGCHLSNGTSRESYYLLFLQRSTNYGRYYLPQSAPGDKRTR